MFEPIQYPRRPFLGPVMLLALASYPALGMLLSAPLFMHSRQKANIVRVTLIAPPPPLADAPLSRATAKPEQPTVQDAAHAPARNSESGSGRREPSGLEAAGQLQDFRKRFEDYVQVGRDARARFQFLVSVDEDWFGFLTAYDACLVFSPGLPVAGSPVLVYDPRAQALEESDLGSHLVLRVIEDPSRIPVPGFEEILRRARAHFQQPVRVYTAYPQSLLWAMEGKTVTVLRARQLDPERVMSVTVRYVPAGMSDYDVSIQQVENR